MTHVQRLRILELFDKRLESELSEEEKDELNILVKDLDKAEFAKAVQAELAAMGDLVALRAENATQSKRIRDLSTGIEAVAAHANKLALGEPLPLGVSGIVFMCDHLLAAPAREPEDHVRAAS